MCLVSLSLCLTSSCVLGGSHPPFCAPLVPVLEFTHWVELAVTAGLSGMAQEGVPVDAVIS